MGDVQYFSWQKLLQEVLDEQTDLEQLPEKLRATEDAIFLRMGELKNSLEGRTEMEAIHRACEELLSLKIKRLKWADLKFLAGPHL